jgi:hypothetical protein
MNKLILTTISTLLLTCFSFSQQYVWAEADTISLTSYNSKLIKDLNGNIIILEKNDSGLLVIKYDVNHLIQWQKLLRAPGIGDYGLLGLCSDNLGNIYITSRFNGNLYFNNTLCVTIYGGNMFLMKLNAQGTFLWVKHTTGNHANGWKLTCDLQNNIYVAGGLNGSVYFDSININRPCHCNYLAKYSNTGQLIWVKNIIGCGMSQWGLNLKSDNLGCVYIAGTMTGTAQFDSLTLTSYGQWGFEDIFLAKINPNGNWIWAKNAGGDDQDAFIDMDIDTNDNLYLTGFIGSQTALFGSITLNNSGDDDYFIAKYDTSGNVTWAINGGGPGTQIGNVICTNEYEEVYLCNEHFITKFSPAGNELWWQYKPAKNTDMVSDNNGGIYITGYFQYAVTFDNFTLTASNTNYQMFVAKLYDPPNPNSGEDSYSNLSFSLFPNPSDGIVNCQWSIVNGEPITLEVYNTLGEKMFSSNFKFQMPNFKLDLSGKPKGIYFVEILADRKRMVKKLVIN